MLALGLLPAGAADAATKKPRADLVVSSVTSPPATATPGASFAATDKVRNRGRASAGSSTTRFFLSKDAKIGKGDMRVAEHRVSRLKAGKSLSRRVMLKVPTFAPAGIYRLIACADRRRRVAESSERNNCRTAKRRVNVRRVPLLAPGPAPIPGPSVPGGLNISPGTQVFSSTAVGSSSAVISFTVTNTGATPSGTLGTSMVGPDHSQFGIASDDCAGKTLAGGATCTIGVRFSPTSTGARLAGVQVAGKPGGTVAAELTGVGLTPAKLGISPGSRAYGTVSAGSPSAPTTFTITNTGEAASGPVTTALAGTDASQFTISSNTCSNATLAGGATCTVGVSFAPTAEGPKSASLQASATPGGTVSAALSGTGTLFTITPTSKAFGSTPVGVATAAQEFTVRNVGTSPSIITGASVSGADGSHFPITGNTCVGTLPANQPCTVTVTFSPSSAGAKSATLQVAGAPGGTVLAALTGTALTPANLTLEPAAGHSFGLVPLNTQSAPAVFTVRNTGETASGSPTTALAGTDASQFTISANSCGSALAGGATCTISVRFAPSSVGPKTASLQVTASPGTPVGGRTAALSGEGTALTITPSSGSFSAPVGTTSPGTQFTVTNTSGSGTPTLAATLTGTDAAQFSKTADTCNTSIAAGASCTVTVTFNPTGSAGSRSATLQVSGGPGYNARAPLTGTAT